jgi:hypothetical protein
MIIQSCVLFPQRFYLESLDIVYCLCKIDYLSRALCNKMINIEMNQKKRVFISAAVFLVGFGLATILYFSSPQKN